MWSRIVIASLALGGADAFSALRIRSAATTRRMSSLADDVEVAAPAAAPAAESVAEPAVEAAVAEPVVAEPVVAEPVAAAAAAEPAAPLGDNETPKVSNFKARDRSKWANAGYSKHAGSAESEVYHLLLNSPLVEEGKVSTSALLPLVEMTRERPAMLDGTHAGDIGFDPMGYASTDELLYFYLESEVKHGRLAMLGALGWIGAELANPGMRAPNVLNGHIFEPINFLGTLALFGAWSYLEHQVYPAQYIEHTPNNGKHNYLHYMDGPYVAGNYEFDPLNLYSALGDDAAGRRAMRELEVQHGRYAMLGLTSWVLAEQLTGAPVADLFAVFFKPFWRWGLPVVGENAVLGTLEFGALVAAGLTGAYMAVNEIDSVKYQGDGDPDYTFFPSENEK